MTDHRAHGPTLGAAARRGRPPSPVMDRTALNGPRVDVAARIGWTLRAARMAVRPELGLRELVDELGEHGVGVSESTLSRLEAGRVRSGALVDGYERVLGLPPTSLRGPLDILARGFGEATGRERPEPSLASVSAGVEPVLDGVHTATSWLALADTLSHPQVIALPQQLAVETFGVLASELRRSVGHGYAARYEAMSLLRCSRYADAVLEIGLALVDQPGAAPLLDLTSALGELPTSRLVSEMGRRLAHDSLAVVVSAVAALENARVVGGLGTQGWAPLADPLVAAYHAAVDDPARHSALSHLVRVLGPELRAEVLPRLRVPLLDPVRQPVTWSQDRANEHLALAGEVADRVTARAGLPEQPMLARLLFEALYDFRATREVTSTFLMMGLPFADDLAAEVAALVTDGPDEATRSSATALMTRMRCPAGAPHAAGWVDDPALALPAALVLAHAGRRVDHDVLAPHLAVDGPEAATALVAMGLTGHPALEGLAGEASRPWLAARARWVLADGPTVAD